MPAAIASVNLYVPRSLSEFRGVRGWSAIETPLLATEDKRCNGERISFVCNGP
jgi:hypothetical protein